MTDRTLTINGIVVPRFLYGTAWKEERTQDLTELALQLGFRGIDTANQRRHYDEAAVGQAISASIASGLVAREDLFVQTKFTFRRGQDHRQVSQEVLASSIDSRSSIGKMESGFSIPII